MATPSVFQAGLTEALYNDLLRANTEAAKKERFLQYLSLTFAGDSGAQRMISDITLGAERWISNITRGGRIASGRADSQTDTIIVEWEKDLNRTGEHARKQLEEYLEGNWQSGQEYHFVLLTTDGIRWRRYAPDWSEAPFGDFSLGRNFKLREIRRFDLAPNCFAVFPFFLDEVLFATQLRAATLENIQTDFGDTSRVFINSMACLQQCAKEDIENQSELKVAFEQWRRFLSVAYGKFDDSPMMFLVHTYLSIFAKFIAFSVVTKRSILDDITIKGVLNGSVFNTINIDRFVEDDFFHWVAVDPYYRNLEVLFRNINREIANYDFSDVQEDILKGVYQELIDLETRHALGEYYTPDWLCERVVKELEIFPSSSFLDPACGSGSFLRAIIARMKREFPMLGAEALAEQVVGIDIHPLSVLIAKTTVLLSLGAAISEARRPVTLHVYLANSLLVPRGSADLLGSSFKISLDNKNYVLNLKEIAGADQFDQLITFCDSIVRRYEAVQPIKRVLFLRLLKTLLPRNYAKELPDQLYDIYKGMKIASVEGRDSIWKFILQNSYKPIFLASRFDHVVGNPPWLTYAAITNGDYQALLRNLSDEYGVTPSSIANMPHLEIAAIFLAHSVNYFLKPSGMLTFVLPRSFMSADQHDNTRSGLVKGVRLTKAWDLGDVSMLFRVPCCILFAVRTSDLLRAIPRSGIPGLAFSGRLPRTQIHWVDAEGLLSQEPRRWYYSRLQGTRAANRSALTAESMAGLVGANAYTRRFTQGATIVPRNFFFVECEQPLRSANDLRQRVVALHTSPASDREAKVPWKGQLISGRAEGALLFRTAISRNIIPFTLVDPPLVLLPLVGGEDDVPFQVLTAEGLMEKGFTYASEWFFKAEKLWETSKTENNRALGTTLADYLNWQNKLTGQNPRARWLVLYTSSATDASAAVVDRCEFDCPFVVDHKAYWCECSTEAEAHYLSAYINSGWANGMIKEFQSRGLFGPRDIHKLIVKLPFPKFRNSDPEHATLSALGRKCAALAADFAKRVNVSDLQARALGMARARLKDHMAMQLDSIDTLVATLSGAKSDVHRAIIRKRAKRSTKTRELFD